MQVMMELWQVGKVWVSKTERRMTACGLALDGIQ
jgi:hypothetical protein